MGVAIKRNSVSIESIRRELHAFEVRYGVPSDRLVEAFTIDGLLQETEDFHRWTSALASYRVLAGAET